MYIQRRLFLILATQGLVFATRSGGSYFLQDLNHRSGRSWEVFAGLGSGLEGWSGGLGRSKGLSRRLGSVGGFGGFYSLLVFLPDKKSCDSCAVAPSGGPFWSDCLLLAEGRCVLVPSASTQLVQLTSRVWIHINNRFDVEQSNSHFSSQILRCSESYDSAWLAPTAQNAHKK